MARQQSGYALLSLLLIATALSSVYLVNGLGQSSGEDAVAQRATLRALHEAQVALIAYASMEDNTPGTFPCPAPGADGKSGPTCFDATHKAALGRVPWHLLGLTAPKDGAGECLWYALSLTHRNQPGYSARENNDAATPAIHRGTSGRLSLHDGSVQSTGEVALLISPGPALREQIGLRTAAGAVTACSGGPATAFLEDFDTASGQFSGRAKTATFNDEVRSIDRYELMRPVLKRVMRVLSRKEVREEIAARLQHAAVNATGALAELRNLDGKQHEFDLTLDPNAPSPVAGADCSHGAVSPAAWLCANRWHEQIEYSRSQQSLRLSLNDVSHYACVLSIESGLVRCGSDV